MKSAREKRALLPWHYLELVSHPGNECYIHLSFQTVITFCFVTHPFHFAAFGEPSLSLGYVHEGGWLKQCKNVFQCWEHARHVAGCESFIPAYVYDCECVTGARVPYPVTSAPTSGACKV